MGTQQALHTAVEILRVMEKLGQPWTSQSTKKPRPLLRIEIIGLLRKIIKVPLFCCGPYMLIALMCFPWMMKLEPLYTQT